MVKVLRLPGSCRKVFRETVAKYPILGDIPVLGALFRSSQYLKNETELVIIVTPRLVKPLDLVKQPLPTDYYLEPNDFELMLLGYVEGAPHKPSLPSPMEPKARGKVRFLGLATTRIGRGVWTFSSVDERRTCDAEAFLTDNHSNRIRVAPIACFFRLSYMACHDGC